MRDTLAMRRFERAGQLNGKRQRLIERKGPFDFRSFHILHDQVIRPDVIELANVRMIQGGYRTRPALNPVTELRGRSLEGDDAIKPRIAGFPHLAHAARADARKNFVRSE